MAHIADCLLDVDPDAEEYDPSLGLNNYIAKALSPPDSNDSVCNHFNHIPARIPSLAVGQSSPVTRVFTAR